MKKLLFCILTSLCLLFSSCITSTYAETEVGNEDITVVIRYGTPYYYNGALVYYLYNGYYFYPYTYRNHIYYHRYNRPLPPPRRHGYTQPRPIYRGHGNTVTRPPITPRNNPNHNNGRNNNNRGSHFGGRR